MGKLPFTIPTDERHLPLFDSEVTNHKTHARRHASLTAVNWIIRVMSGSIVIGTTLVS